MPNIKNTLDYINSKEFVKDFIAGGSSSALGVFFSAPITRVKLILQIQRSLPLKYRTNEYKGIYDAFKRIPKEEGFYSFWRGNTANTIKTVLNTAFNFSLKEAYQEFFLEGVDKKICWMYLGGHLAAGGAAGATTTIFFHPLDYITTKMALFMGKGSTKYTMRAFIYKTFNKEGLCGFYKGFITALQGAVIFRSTYFGLYDFIKITAPYSQNNLLASLVTAQFVTLFAATLTYPFETVSKRIMLEKKKKSEKVRTKDFWTKIAAQEGIKSFFKGSLLNIWSNSGTAVVLVLYDKLREVM